MRRNIKTVLYIGLLFCAPLFFVNAQSDIPKPRKPIIYSSPAPSVLVNPPPKYDSCCICQYYDGSHEIIKKGGSLLCDQWLNSSSCDYKLKAPFDVSLLNFFKNKPNSFINQCKSTKVNYFGHGRSLAVSANVIKICFSITEKDLSLTEHGCSTFDNYEELLSAAKKLQGTLKPGQTLQWTGNQANASMVVGDKKAYMKKNTHTTVMVREKNKSPEIIFPECKMLGDEDPVSGGRSCETNIDPFSTATAFCRIGSNQMTMLCCPFVTKGKVIKKVFNWAFPVNGGCPDESSFPPLIIPNF